jgi:radical SAM superfamily enzyme YgiQ (UPF0313 family)
MRILLIYPPCKKFYQPIFPLGLAYIAGSLLKSGHEIEVLDINAERWTEDEVVKKIKKLGDSYHLAGISALTGDHLYVEWLCHMLKKFKPEIQIVLGGHLASALPQFLMEQLPVDYVVVGEGEETIVELADRVASGIEPDSVPGLYFRARSGKIIQTAARPRVKDLDALPLPPWRHFPMSGYLEASFQGYDPRTPEKGVGAMSIMASRGCPFDCIYCDHTIKGYPVRYRSVGSVLNELKQLIAGFGDRIQFFYFWDDILIWDPEWVYDFCNALLNEKLKIRWTCNAHVKKVDARLMGRMKDAGCFDVRFGIESGSQQTLDWLNKGVKVEKTIQALKTCLDVGLNITIYMLVGAKGETQARIDKTMEFIRTIINPGNVRQITAVHFFMITPFPGTQLYDMVATQGMIKDTSIFLKRGFDACEDIPLNISGCSDDELRGWKKNLELSTAQWINRQTMSLYHFIQDAGKELESCHSS